MINRGLSRENEAQVAADQPLDDVVSAFVTIHRSGKAFSLPTANDPQYEPTVRNVYAIADRIDAQRGARIYQAGEQPADSMPMTSSEALAYARGRSDERAAVVAWLQAEGDRL